MERNCDTFLFQDEKIVGVFSNVLWAVFSGFFHLVTVFQQEFFEMS